MQTPKNLHHKCELPPLPHRNHAIGSTRLCLWCGQVWIVTKHNHWTHKEDAMSKRRNLERRAKAKAKKLLEQMTLEERQALIEKLNAKPDTDPRP